VECDSKRGLISHKLEQSYLSLLGTKEVKSIRTETIKHMFKGGPSIAIGQSFSVVSLRGETARYPLFTNESAQSMIGARAIAQGDFSWKGNLFVVKRPGARLVMDADFSDLRIVGDYLRERVFKAEKEPDKRL